MKSLPGITTRTGCLDCQTQGIITGYIAPMVYMKCPQCGSEWRTLSAICKACKNPSGFPYMSDCIRCAKKEKKVS